MTWTGWDGATTATASTALIPLVIELTETISKVTPVGLYSGETDDQGRPNGHGIMEYHDEGGRYEGAWEKGKEQGFGVFENEWWKYVGMWEDGEEHGHGVKEHSDGDRYVGEWEFGWENGHGICTYADGDRHVGEWVNGDRHGKGTYHFQDGTIIEGSWVADIFRDSYQGEMKDGIPHGLGRYTSPEYGYSYAGEWKNGKEHGFGVFEYPDGEVYQGGWFEGHWDGKGRHYFDVETYLDCVFQVGTCLKVIVPAREGNEPIVIEDYAEMTEIVKRTRLTGEINIESPETH